MAAAQVNEAAKEILSILVRLSSPREAAAALAVVRANVHLQAGAETEAAVRRMIEDDNAAALEIWTTISGVPLGH